MSGKGVPATLLAEKLGIAAATVKAWKKKYGSESFPPDSVADFLPLKVKDASSSSKTPAELTAVKEEIPVVPQVCPANSAIGIQVTRISLNLPESQLETVLSKILAGEVLV